MITDVNAAGLPYLDLEEGLGRIGGNKMLFSRLLDTFVKDTNWDTLCQEAAAGKLPEAGNAAHAIKGMCANLSMKALSAAAAELEQAFKAGTNDDALLERVRSEREKTMEVVAEAKAQLA
ncbi:Hpt domain-containing protein [Ruminococcaceae bacterium OttesenSCG-928-L11]|nr:Hpt domain-containing protein [Ruminococcaceae bacterium OttesenSCG-928-L11]